MRKIFSLSIFLIFLLQFAQAQITNPVSWSFNSRKISDTEYELYFDAKINKGWHLYSNELPGGGPIPTSFIYDDTHGFSLIGELETSPDPVEVFDEIFNLDLGYFGDEVRFTQKIKISDPNLSKIEGFVEYMSCDDERCTPPAETPFIFSIETVNTSENLNGYSEKENTSTNSVLPGIEQIPAPDVVDGLPLESGREKSRGLFLFLIVAFVAGLAAILTPCVFPMIPMTVSFFMRGSENKSKAIKTALFFGFSIVLIYTLLGALFSVGIFGPNIGSVLSTHWIPNTLFFILFFIFALSFFGLFELVLPSSLVNKTDAKADQGGFAGAFFMALTTVIVSFSCTGPFIGYLIIEAVQGGGMRPMLGLFAFGLAFATPFTLLAIFPSALKKMPKSGGWLNAIKVVFAFILLAFGLKFLSNIDQVYGFNILNREIYLAIWIVIFFMLGMYLLGKLRFAHDSETKHVGVGRLLLSMASFVFTIYLFTGLLGAPLRSVSSLLPPQTAGYQSTTISAGGSSVALPDTPACGPAKYADKLHLPYGLPGYFDYEQGMACAEEQNKPVFLVFKGHACANCKKMENTVWNQPEVLKMLSEDYVVIALYTDDRTSLPEEEWKVSSFDGRTLKTMGRVNLDMLMSQYNINSIPYHVIITPDGTEYELEVTYDNKVFSDFLEKGL
jgi:thiol:disulfide interchange protein DsbD